MTRALSGLFITFLGLVWNVAPAAAAEAAPVAFTSFPLPVGAMGKTGFSALPESSTGISFTNLLSKATIDRSFNSISGSGVALGDVDGDGLVDIYFCSLDGHNRLYRNLGNWKFADITAQAGVECAGQISRGAVLVDIDGDGDLDLLVTGLGKGVRLFLNDGKGLFTESTAPAGLTSRSGAMTLAVGDLDGDGKLDFYVSNFGAVSPIHDNTGFSTVIQGGQQVVRGRYANRLRIINGKLIEYGEPDQLYFNRGAAVFQAAEWDSPTFTDENGKPMPAPWDFGLSVAIRDLNGDGFPDIYVCNDFQTPDRIWLNDGKGHFHTPPAQMFRHIPYASMGVDFADINRDGMDDFMVIEMLAHDPLRRMRQFVPDHTAANLAQDSVIRPQTPGNALYLNRGDNTMVDLALFYGIEATDWSWQPVFIDVDLDGYEDLLITTGHPHDMQDLDVTESAKRAPAKSQKHNIITDFPPSITRSYAYRNERGSGFREIEKEWGFDAKVIGHGIALGDLDGDGALDVVVNCLNAPPLIYRNLSGAPRVAVRLKGEGGNTAGIGSKIILRDGAVPLQSQEMMAGGRYLSGDQAERVFAAGSLTNRMTLEVLWRSGKRSFIEGVTANRLYEVNEAAAEAARPRTPLPTPTPWLKEFAATEELTHHETEYDDYARQKLLPRKLSQLGPGVGWFDLTGSSREELILGAGKGGQLRVVQLNGEKIQALKIEGANSDDDWTGLAAWGPQELIVAQASYEHEGPSKLFRAKGSATSLKLEEIGTVTNGSIGPVAVSEVNGKRVLAVGSRVIPGRYPLGGGVTLWSEQAGQWTSDVLQKDGMITGLVWSDLNGDGQPELIVVGEWEPIRIYGWNKSKWEPQDWGLEGLTGFWNGVTAGDLDGDGKPDLIVSNWGLNSGEHASKEEPTTLYAGEWAGNGSLDIMEAYWYGGKLMPKRQLTLIETALPWVREKYPTHKAYAEAGVAAILGERFKSATVKQATELRSMVLLNRGNKFELKPLPGEAQYAPGFGVSVGDLDGDGNEDVILAQNFFGVRPEDGRLDGGRGVVMKGDGKGGLEVIRGQESGLLVWGEGRGCAVGDWDGDGKLDVAMGENGASFKIYQNQQAKPGLRVKLKGPEGNELALGAAIRLVYVGGTMGPVHELRGGGGYWSQDGLVQVLGKRGPIEAVWVRWPGGKEMTIKVADNAIETEIQFSR